MESTNIEMGQLGDTRYRPKPDSERPFYKDISEGEESQFSFDKHCIRQASHTIGTDMDDKQQRMCCGTWFHRKLERQYEEVSGSNHTKYVRLLCICMATFFFIYYIYATVDQRTTEAEGVAQVRLLVPLISMIA